MKFNIGETVASMAGTGVFGTNVQNIIAAAQNPPPVNLGKAPSGQPAPTPPFTSHQPMAPFYQNPKVLMIGGGILAIVVVLFLARKK